MNKFMKIPALLLLVVLAAPAIILAAIAPVPTTNNQQEHQSVRVQEILEANPLLDFIGAVDKKSYFMENSTRRTWTQAKAHCESMNMNLASVASQAQHAFFLSNYQVLGIDAYHWMGGRDALSVSQFVWDPYLTPVEQYGQYIGSTVRTALSWRSYSATQGYLYARAITETLPILCELG